MDELYYEPHLARWKRMFGGDSSGAAISPENLRFLEGQAQYDHALAVWDPLFELSTRVTLELPEKLKSSEARIGSASRSILSCGVHQRA